MNDIYDRLRKPSGNLPRQKPVPAVSPRSSPVDKAPVESLWSPNVEPHNIVRPQRKAHLKPIFIAAVFIILVAGGSAGGIYLRNRNLSARNQPTGKPAPAEQPRSQAAQAASPIRLVATGDMIAHESINQNARRADGSYDYAALMDKMKPYFTKADIRFCNQSTPAGGEQFGISGYPSFNAPVEFARGIESVGCNLINLGTNHTYDKGQPLVDATVKAWDDRPNVLDNAGANRSVDEKKRVRAFTVKGVKFAFFSYSTYTNQPITNGFGVTMYDKVATKAEIVAAKAAADVVIVSMRWGTEYSPDVNAAQDQTAQVLADAGADVILGHGPHTLQSVKQLKAADGRDVPVWFSLGNFLNSQLDIETLIGGFAVMDIDVASKKITNLSFLPVYQHYEWTAAQKARANAADLAARNNFQMIPLDQAADLLAKSQHQTTVQAQTDRIQKLLNKYTPVPIMKSSAF